MRHHLRYLLSLTLLAILPEIYFLSKLPDQKILLSFLVALIGMSFIMRADMGTTKGGKTDPKKWVWDFNKESILGVKISNLPIEEFLFPLVWIPLPIALWEYVKNIKFQNGVEMWILAGCLIAAFLVFPQLAKPDEKL